MSATQTIIVSDLKKKKRINKQSTQRKCLLYNVDVITEQIKIEDLYFHLLILENYIDDINKDTNSCSCEILKSTFYDVCLSLSRCENENFKLSKIQINSPFIEAGISFRNYVTIEFERKNTLYFYIFNCIRILENTFFHHNDISNNPLTLKKEEKELALNLSRVVIGIIEQVYFNNLRA